MTPSTAAARWAKWTFAISLTIALAMTPGDGYTPNLYAVIVATGLAAAIGAGVVAIRQHRAWR